MVEAPPLDVTQLQEESQQGPGMHLLATRCFYQQLVRGNMFPDFGMALCIKMSLRPPRPSRKQRPSVPAPSGMQRPAQVALLISEANVQHTACIKEIEDNCVCTLVEAENCCSTTIREAESQGNSSQACSIQQSHVQGHSASGGRGH